MHPHARKAQKMVTSAMPPSLEKRKQEKLDQFVFSFTAAV